MVQMLGKEVGQTGLGLMGMTWRAQVTPDDQAFEALKAALSQGTTLWNGGEFYGDIVNGPNSLTLLNKYFTKYPEDKDKVVLCIKGGMQPPFTLDTSPEGIRKSVENCLRLLPPSVKKIDLFELGRLGKGTPIEKQIEVLAEFVKDGKIGGISLSEVGAESIRRAAKVHKIEAVEGEVSLWEFTYLENGVMDACAELNIPFVAYSPLGRGFLTGQLKSRADIPEGDFRAFVPRFSEENFPKNLELVEKLKAFAEKKGCTPAQLALAWVRAFNGKSGFPAVIPIPGATHANRVNENCKIFELSEQENQELDAIVKNFSIVGTRYPAAAMADLEA